MKKEIFLRKIDNLCDLEPGTLVGNEVLKHLSFWDSLMVLGFLSLVDKDFNVILSPVDVTNALTVNDLIKLLGDRIQE